MIVSATLPRHEQARSGISTILAAPFVQRRVVIILDPYSTARGRSLSKGYYEYLGAFNTLWGIVYIPRPILKVIGMPKL